MLANSTQKFLSYILPVTLLFVSITLNAQEICNNGIDDDGDNLVDYDDPDCSDFGQGSVFFERWNGISGNDLSTLTSNENYPYNPSEFGFLSDFSGPQDYGNGYGTRVRGYIHPIETGDYTFTITGDDYCQFYISPDADPAGKVLAASIIGWTGVNEFDKYGTQESNPISLVAGQKYYVEFLHKEGGGGDHFSVFWQTPSNSTRTLIDGSLLSPFPVEICGDGIDNDGDGNADCIDADCDNITPCQDIGGVIFATDQSGPSGVVAYQVFLTNNSTTTANFSISETLPIGFAFSQDTVDFEGAGSYSKTIYPNENEIINLQWGTITLPAGETVRLAYEVIVGSGVPNGSYANKIELIGADLTAGFLSTLVNIDSDLTENPSTYVCEPAFYQVYKRSGNNQPNVYGKLDPVTGDYDQIAIASDFANGLGFDTNTGLVFGASGNKFIQLDADGIVIDLGIRFPKNCFKGDMHPNGYWYGTVGSDMYKVNPSVPEIVDIHYGQGLTGWDFAYNIDDNFYAVHKTKLYKFDTSTNNSSFVGDITGDNLPNSGYGGQWTGSDGFLYGSNNSTGKIVRVDVESLEARVVSTATGGLSKNDGFSCPMDIPAVYEFDYGDNSALPDVRILTYYQDIGNDGVPDYTTVFLGSTVDYDETDPKNANADGDNDDGFSITEVVNQGSIEASLLLNSNASLTAFYVIGIDWDDDGVFDDVILGNRSVNGLTNTFVTLAIPEDFTGGQVNARAVVSETPLTVSAISGDQIVMGEVEDLLLNVQFSSEICNNCIDDDGDGLADCLDPDCAGSASCGEICYNGIDDDGDGQIDENDSDCPSVAYNSCFMVNNLGDTEDVNRGDGICQDINGNCTLRAAMEEANSSAGYNCIAFSTSGDINLTSPLPNIIGSLKIDGKTAPGYSNGNPSIWIRTTDDQVFLIEEASDIEISGLDLSATNSSSFENFGIVLANATNVNINFNRIRNRVRGVYSSSSGDVQITDNDLRDSGFECWDAAVYFKDVCASNILGGIFVKDNLFGGLNTSPQTTIHVDKAENLIVSDGSIPNTNIFINSSINVLHPIRFVDVRNSEIRNVNLSYSGPVMWGIGIWTVSCDNLLIDNVVINNRMRGVFVKEGNNHVITNSDFRDTGYNADNGVLTLENYNASGTDDLLFKFNQVGSVSKTPMTIVNLINSNNIVFGSPSNTQANIALDQGLDLEVPIRINASDNITIKDLDFSVSSSTPFGKAILVNGGSNYTIVEGCSFKYRNVAVHLEDATNAALSCSMFARNNYGLLMDNSSTCSGVSGNNFGCNSLAIRNRASLPLNTSDNYWGDAFGSSSHAGFGDYYFGDVNAEQYSPLQKSCAPQISGTVCSAEICDNGIDDDGDGVVDCADGGCLTSPVCDGGYQANAITCGLEVSFNENNEGWRVMANQTDGLVASHSSDANSNQDLICAIDFIPASPSGNGFILGSDFSEDVQCMKSPNFGGLFAGAAMGGVMHWYWWNDIPQDDSLQVQQNNTLRVYLEGMDGTLIHADIQVEPTSEWQFLTLPLSDDVWSGTGQDLESVLTNLKHITIQVESLSGENQLDCAQSEFFAIDDILLCADSDRDGVSDYLDNCPNDAEKLEPGICGCGMIDYDAAGNLNCLIDITDAENISTEVFLEVLSEEYSQEQFFDFISKFYQETGIVPNEKFEINKGENKNDNRSKFLGSDDGTPFSMYPNPNDGSFTIDFYGDQGNLKIYDIRARVIKEIDEMVYGKYKVNLQEFPKGMYIVEVTTNSASFKKRMVVD